MIQNLLHFSQNPSFRLEQEFKVRAISACQSIGIFGLLTGDYIFGFTPVAVAQIIPDDTLGAEQSVIQNSVEVRGALADQIEGGALRDANLFHSFLEFNVALDQRVYFANPVGVENILSRVTGGNPSEILGTLGVDGAASLFLINPNGILFSESAVLDIQGSFTGTTANAVRFGEQGSFSATSPEPPSALLTVDPSAYVFNQIGTGSIINRSVAFNNGAFGLRVGDGQTLTLLSPEIRFEGGQARGFNGDIQIGGIAESGVITLNADGTLSFPEDVKGANITLSGSRIETFDQSDIYFYANNLLIDGSSIFPQIDSDIYIQAESLFVDNASILAVFATDSRDSGDAFISAGFVDIANNSTIGSNSLEGVTGSIGSIFIETDQLEIREGSRISSGGLGLSDSGGITIEASEAVRLSGRSSIVSDPTSNEFAQGKTGGNIIIDSRFLDIQGFSTIQSTASSVASAGSINISVQEDINLNQGAIYANTLSVGDAGNIKIETNRIRILEGSVISTFTGGTEAEGNAGNIVIQAGELIEISGQTLADLGDMNQVDFVSTINSDTTLDSEGNGGSIIIEADQLRILNGANISALSLNGGNPGNISISANVVDISGWQTPLLGSGLATSGIFLRTSEADTLAEPGNLEINTQRLTISDGGTIDASVIQGLGSGGRIQINASELILIDGDTTEFSSGTSSFFPTTQIFSGVLLDAEGSGGEIVINTPQLELLNGARIDANVSSFGNAGNITIRANEVNLAGVRADGFTSQISSRVNSSAVGDGGNIRVYVEQLTVRDGGAIAVNTAGRGNGGSLTIDAGDVQLLGNSSELIGGFFSGVGPDAVGNSGNQRIRADRLLVQGGARISAITLGEGDAGNILIEADTVQVSGADEDGFLSTIQATVAQGANGNGGSIDVNTNQLVVEDGASIETSTFGNGNAGDLRIRANDIQVFGADDFGFNSAILATVIGSAIGDGGNLQIETNNLVLREGGQIATTTGGIGNAGDINIFTSSNIVLDGANPITGSPSGILARTRSFAQGVGGDINIDTGSLRLLNGGVINAQTFNQFPSGDIAIRAETIEAINGGQIVTSTSSRGEAGDITLNVTNVMRFAGQDATYDNRLQQTLNIEGLTREDFGNESPFSGLFANTRTDSTGNGGQIAINAPTLILEDGAQISSQSLGSGIAGDIRLNSRDRISLTNSDIITTAAQSSGGNIEVNTGEGSEQALLILNGDSDITTESFGDGGNITLGGLAIIAFDDSDIIARSQSARGGNITLSNFFSETVSPDNQEPFDGDDKVDVNADGQITAGVISFPDISFIENSLTDLPNIPVNTDSLIAGSCIARTQDDSSSFIITGTGGLPARPGRASTSTYPTGTVRTTPTEMADANSNSAPAWSDDQPVVEPQGVYQLADGRLVMSRECPSDNP